MKPFRLSFLSPYDDIVSNGSEVISLNLFQHLLVKPSHFFRRDDTGSNHERLRQIEHRHLVGIKILFVQFGIYGKVRDVTCLLYLLEASFSHQATKHRCDTQMTAIGRKTLPYSMQRLG